MCESGSRTFVEVTVDASVAYENEQVRKLMPIDSCLSDLIHTLDRRGVRMLASCCGHGNKPGYILLTDRYEIQLGFVSVITPTERSNI